MKIANVMLVAVKDVATIVMVAVKKMSSLAAENFKKDPTYRPYCLMCDSMARMVRTDYGFQCSACKNKINTDMTHHDDAENTPSTGTTAQ